MISISQKPFNLDCNYKERHHDQDEDTLTDILHEKNNDTFDNNSIYREDYLEWKLEKLENYKPAANYTPRSERFDDSSSYKMDYIGQSGEKLEPIRHSTEGLTFDLYGGAEEPMSSYREDYRRKRAEKMASYRPENHYEPITADEADMRSSYSQEFVKRRGSPTRSFKPHSVYQKPDEKFSVKSSYNEEFVKNGRPQPASSFRPDNTYKPSLLPFDTDTTYAQNYKTNGRIKLEPIENFKPKSHYHFPKVPMENASSYNSDFQKVRIQSEDKAQSFRPVNKFTPPSDVSDFKSSYNSEYQKHKKSPRCEAILQNDQIELSKEKFTSQTNYKSQFSPSSSHLIGEKAQPIKPTYSYQPPNEPFPNATNYSADFMKRNNLQRMVKTQAIRYEDELKLSAETTGDYRTTMKDDFTKKKRTEPFVRSKGQPANLLNLQHPM